MAPPNPQVHMLLFPLMAQGHMIPMIDIARLLAKRGVIITLITTPVNAGRFRTVLNRSIISGLQIRVIELEFPWAEAGLPERCENFDLLPSSVDLSVNMFSSTDFFQKRVEELFKELSPRPSCIISDMCVHHTSEVAKRFKVPRIVFHGVGCFCLMCLHCLQHLNVLETFTSALEYFVFPGLPDRLEFTKAQLPVAQSPEVDKIFQRFGGADLASYGVIVNSFEELEPAYVNEYKKVRGGKVWCIGPVSLYNKDHLDMAERGNKASISQEECLKWLDSKEPGSVLYACLGSLCTLAPLQLQELAIGLEASNRPFIWVTRENDQLNELEEWIAQERFEEKTKGQGMLIRGWAPQVLILSHGSVGGFLTHCGWNSTIEGICAGIPMLTWPLFGDQFCNEKLIVEVLKTSVRVGADVPVYFRFGEGGDMVRKGDVEKAIDELMDGGHEGEERRRRAIELGEKAKRAIEEGGSSYLNLTLFIQEIEQLVQDGFN
ncbi:hypothetical protein CRG98_018777 [Punica granatum]|uniref:Glycosyltransferase n=1 Tax=Punica granatum TaxID=22663 RepID=A0A2I0JWU6_PUNGR|nr:hypothetical protein CRG98_018777 [Punica granatum]